MIEYEVHLGVVPETVQERCQPAVRVAEALATVYVAATAVWHIEPGRYVQRVIQLAKGAEKGAHVARPKALNEELHDDQFGAQLIQHELGGAHKDPRLETLDIEFDGVNG